MPQALSNLVDGQIPGSRYVGSAAELSPGEVMVSDASYDPTLVWNAATQTLRPRTAAETLAKAKADKELAIKQELNNWYMQDVRSVEGDITVYKKSVGAVLTADETSIFNAVNSNYTKRNTAVTSVRNATTVAQVNAVAIPTWDRVS